MNEFDYYKRESEKLMKTVEVKIRLPEDIHAQLKELAAKEGRSMNKQITWILTKSNQLAETPTYQNPLSPYFTGVINCKNV